MKILVANRGEIATRVFKTCKERGIPCVAIYSEVDKDSVHASFADESICIGEPRSYLDIETVISAAKTTGATAIHPGYGFLSENPVFVDRCKEEGIVFIGPTAESMYAFADKSSARVLADKHNVPVVPGAETCENPEQATIIAAEIGYPVLLKAAAGGGGKGMRKVFKAEDIPAAFESASREGVASFGDGRLLLEKYVFPARHIEVQVVGDGKTTIAVGERECSLQRRYQKVLEEAPAKYISEKTKEGLRESAIRLCEAVNYTGAGTVEFLVGPDGDFYFLEVNTRLQVEHPVSELVAGVDLVAAQIDVAHGKPLPEVMPQRGHSLEARLNAEDAYGGYMPQSGPLLALRWPTSPHIRIDSGVEEGGEISPHYDSMIAKVIVWGETREVARKRLIYALKETVLMGIKSNQSFLIDILESEFFIEGETYTTTVESTTWEAPDIPVEIKEYIEELPSEINKGSSATTTGYSSWKTALGRGNM